MSPTEDFPLVIAALPYFRIRAREDYLSAEKMLATLEPHRETLTDEQRRHMVSLAAQTARYRVIWGRPAHESGAAGPAASDHHEPE